MVPLRSLRPLVAGLLVAGSLMLAQAIPTAAAPAPYQRAVAEALRIVRAGGGDDAAVADRALRALQGGVHDQLEIEGDLRSRPPLLADARSRLEALAAALDHPARTANPDQAAGSLRAIMAEPRYAGLQESPWDRLRQWALDRLVELIRLLLGTSAGWSAPVRILIAGGAVLALAGAAALLVRGLWRSPKRLATEGRAAEHQVRAGRRFAEADRLAAGGDLQGALRMLTSGVAAALGDERDWDVSPLTVRELLGRAPDAAALTPLVRAFERSAYGGAPPDRSDYARAAAAAAPFRGAAA